MIPIRNTFFWHRFVEGPAAYASRSLCVPSLQGQRVLKKAAESWNSLVGPRRRGKIGRMEGWTDGFFGATAEKGKGLSEQKSLRRNGKITFF